MDQNHQYHYPKINQVTFIQLTQLLAFKGVADRSGKNNKCGRKWSSLNRKEVRDSIKSTKPDELVIMGSKIENIHKFNAKYLGLSKNTTFTIFSDIQRYLLFRRKAGFLTPIVGLGSHKKLRTAIKDILTTKSMHWCKCSTGLIATILAFDRHSKIIVAGIGSRRRTFL